VLTENELPPAAVAAIEQLIAEMPDAPLRPLEEPEAADTADWNNQLLPYLGQSWLEPPWFLVESYFYRRILEAIGYFHPGPCQGYDPFLYSKGQGLSANREIIGALAARLQGWAADGWQAERFAGLLSIALWGNQSDLSLWPASAEDRPDHSDPLQAGAHILVDDTAAVYRHLTAHAGGRIDLITDNAGYEFVADLCLVDYLLATGAAGQIVLNVKGHPYFVSDVTVLDVERMLLWLETSADGAVQALGARLRRGEKDGRLRIQTHSYWTSPLPFWELPDDLRQELAASTLLIFKGDANYRRLLGDRHWPFTTPFAAIVGHTPAPLLALRTLKAELVAGLEAAQIAWLDREEPRWMVNGRWGLIQLAEGSR
jgi:uncharacterized protein with ATP-grasp and redox domains